MLKIIQLILCVTAMLVVDGQLMIDEPDDDNNNFMLPLAASNLNYLNSNDFDQLFQTPNNIDKLDTNRFGDWNNNQFASEDFTVNNNENSFNPDLNDRFNNLNAENFLPFEDANNGFVNTGQQYSEPVELPWLNEPTYEAPDLTRPNRLLDIISPQANFIPQFQLPYGVFPGPVQQPIIIKVTEITGLDPRQVPTALNSTVTPTNGVKNQTNITSNTTAANHSSSSHSLNVTMHTWSINSTSGMNVTASKAEALSKFSRNFSDDLLKSSDELINQIDKNFNSYKSNLNSKFDKLDTNLDKIEEEHFVEKRLNDRRNEDLYLGAAKGR